MILNCQLSKKVFEIWLEMESDKFVQNIPIWIKTLNEKIVKMQ